MISSSRTNHSRGSFVPHGIVVPLITPFKGRNMEEIDHLTLRRLVNFLIENGVDGLMAHGTSGEFLMQDKEEREAVIRTVVEACKGRVPVIAGISASSTKQVTALAARAESSHADAVISTGPIYYKTNDTGLYKHFQSIIDSTKLPLMIYNIPGWVGYEIPPDLIKKLENENPGRVVGVKFTTTDLGLFLEYLRVLGDRMSVLIGADELVFSALELGAPGSVVGGANVIPREYSQIYNSFIKGDISGSKLAQKKIDEFTRMLNLGTYPAAVKAGLRFLGFDCGEVRPPLVPLDRGQLASLHSSLNWKKDPGAENFFKGSKIKVRS